MIFFIHFPSYRLQSNPYIACRQKHPPQQSIELHITRTFILIIYLVKQDFFRINSISLSPKKVERFG